MKKPYKQDKRWLFTVDDEVLAIVDINKERTVIEIEETRKNGQEDTHMRGYMELVNRKWQWSADDDYPENFSEYYSKRFADSIVKFVNEHGLPGDKRAKVGA